MKQSIKPMLAKKLNAMICFARRICRRLHAIATSNVYIGKNIAGLPPNAIVFFPYQENTLCCGIAAIVSYKFKQPTGRPVETARLEDMLSKIERSGCDACQKNGFDDVDNSYLGGRSHVDSLWQAVQNLKCEDLFYAIFTDPGRRSLLDDICRRLNDIITAETKLVSESMGRLPAQSLESMTARIERLKDIAWCIRREAINNIEKIKELCPRLYLTPSPEAVTTFKKINAVLNSLDHLEVRGRDSAGISLMFVLNKSEFGKFENSLKQANLKNELEARCNRDALVNRGISLRHTAKNGQDEQTAVAMTYKVANEIGSLGDNIHFLRDQIAQDGILQILTASRAEFDTISAHTRWASVGAITEANCHPVDNLTVESSEADGAIIHACLNGDIDNYQELKREFEGDGVRIHKDITTDTKIIPLTINKYCRQGYPIDEAFRLAVNDFEGSHAIAMHTDLAPGKIFLAQKGSGQTFFVGIAPDHFIPTSEVYGFVEETSSFIKLDGETVVSGINGPTRGQIFVLNQESAGDLEGIQARWYDGSSLQLSQKDIRHTEITSRDIDRQTYPHYFLKEISESPASVERTLHNRWKIADDSQNYVVYPG